MVATEQAFNTVAESPRERRRLLRIYLADHVAITTAALELARRTRRENAGTPLEGPLRSLEDELVREREDLQRLARQAGAAGTASKQGLAWVGEKLGRLKSNGRLFGYSPLSRVYELEVLLAFAYQRRMMWLALAGVPEEELPRDGIDLRARVDRAEEQRLELEGLMLEAAEAAL